MDTVFFVLSKLGWIVLRPETLLTLLFLWALVSVWRNRPRAAGRTLTLAVGLTLLIGVFPLGTLIVSPLERSYPADPPLEQPVGIIVLGGAEDPGPDFAGYPAEVNEAGDRLIAAIELARRFPDAVVLYSGGTATVTPSPSGAFEVGPDILRKLGLEETRLIVESQSRTTAENAVLSLTLASDIGDGHWVLVTSAFHMPRAMGSFCAAGWRNMIAYPTDFRADTFWDDVGWDLAKHLEALNIAVKEWVGLFAYRMTGRVGDAFPARC